MSTAEQRHTRFLDAGLRILGTDGYPGLKQSAVCTTVGVTTGSFYYAFGSWADYTSALIGYWRDQANDLLIARVESIDDPQERIDALTEVGLQLPHASEAAIRVWAAHDPDVHRAITEVDDARIAVIADSYTRLGLPAVTARHYAVTAVLMMIGYQSAGRSDIVDLDWAFQSLRAQAAAAADVAG
ncbi:TetR/AcrR family transcriptional regulator [Jongsikchunia kroppenstedtii]|uniref:TetR/AcrR family transcriptional regulator n=1 Tax=Jongsikchunia kroppenstedtii TaxID=1121721 RepID=UPI0003607812|nr:TetR/AcrR family transcriptional regulator [Jongsikchunia kroppenstedtii]